jgi:hypothetical protein
MRTENYTHRGYEIQITHNPPIWQAAIYASKPNMPAVDWTHEPISAASVYPPLAEAFGLSPWDTHSALIGDRHSAGYLGVIVISTAASGPRWLWSPA